MEEDGEGRTMEEEEEEEAAEDGGEVAGEEDDDPLPPPPAEDKELLFLIEFLVDTLTIVPENMALENIDPCALQGPTSVTLTFLHFPPMKMGEKDIDSERVTGGNVVQFNSGKSLMFALTESQFEQPPPVFLAVAAVREMPHGYRFPDILVGKTKIQLSELFKQVFDKYDENPGKTVSKSIKDKYELVGEKNKPSGDVTLYIRLTCLGENIVTEFQKAEDLEEPLLFKNKESTKVYECRETEKPEETKAKLLPGWGDERDKKACKWEDEGLEGELEPDPDDENMEEIYAEINGSVVRIKMEKSKRKDKPKEFHISEFCDCNIPLPQNLVAGMSDLSLSPASQMSMNLPAGGGGGKPDKRVGMDAVNQLHFPVPPMEALAQSGPNKSITYSVKTCDEGEKHGHKGKNCFKVVADNNPGGSPPKLPNDPEKDVFILRVIKRGRKDKGKDTLELEFKTPKEKIVPPPKPPYMVDAGSGPEKAKKEKKKK